MFEISPQEFIIKILLITLILYAIKLIYNLIVKPYYLVQYYEKQGADSVYFPGLGFAKANIDSFKMYGDCFRYEKIMASTNPNAKTWVTNLGKNVILHILDPVLLKEFYKNQSVGSTLYSRDLDFWWVFLETTGHNVSFLEGAAWKRHRKAISNPLSSQYIEQISPILIEKISKKIKNFSGKPNLTNFETMCALASEVIGFILFGDEYSSITFGEFSFREFMSELTMRLMTTLTSPSNALLGSWFIKLGLMKDHRKLFQMIHTFKNTCSSLVKAKVNQMKKSLSNEEDLLTQLARSHVLNPSESLDEEEMVGMIAGMIISGVDTTAQMAGMALYYLQDNPMVVKKLKEEISNATDYNYESLNKLDYLDAVIKETLRLSSFANKLIFRVALSDHYVGDIKIKKGTYVTTSFLFNNYCTRYHENPHEFLPERWINQESKTRINCEKDPMIFIPFSAGHRVCMGRNLALYEAKLILTCLLSKYDIKLKKNEDDRWDVKFFYGPIHDPEIKIEEKI